LAERKNEENSSKKYSLLDYETWQKTKIFGEQTAAARNDVIAKKIASGTVSKP